MLMITVNLALFLLFSPSLPLSLGIQTRSQRAAAMTCDSDVIGCTEMLLPVKILKLVVSDIQNILELGDEDQETSSEEEEVSDIKC